MGLNVRAQHIGDHWSLQLGSRVVPASSGCSSPYVGIDSRNVIRCRMASRGRMAGQMKEVEMRRRDLRLFVRC
jgi:hypothetical protein